MSGFYPLFLNIDKKKCLVVGCGAVAARKAASLMECGADVAVVGSKISSEMGDLIHEGKVKHMAQIYDNEQLKGVSLVIGATDDESVNKAVYDAATDMQIPVNIVDQPELCSFIVPSVMRRGGLVIAVSTSGKSPAVAKRVRRLLEQQFGEEWAVYLDMLWEAREKVKSVASGQERREQVFNQLADSDLLKKIKDGDMEGARSLMERIVGS